MASSAGVKKMEVLHEGLSRGIRALVFIGLFLVAYVYGLDGLVRSTYQVLSLSDPFYIPDTG